MRFFQLIILTVFLFFSGFVFSQTDSTVKQDSIARNFALADSLYMKTDADSITIDSIAKNEDSVSSDQITVVAVGEKKQKETKIFKPNPTKAVIYSAIFPGLGQIYNRKYWKLPIVYGGFLGCSYAISWNGAQYDDYRRAYREITDNDPNTNFWQNYLPYGKNPDDMSSSEMNYYTNAFKNKKDFYRRNRDLSIIVTVGVYALCMLDAYVDAQLFDFDISPDLAVRVEPVLYEKTAFNSRSMGLQCSIKF